MSTMKLVIFTLLVGAMTAQDGAIDKCANCDQHAKCLPTQGSFKCQCDPGWTGDGFNCSDVDECSLGTDKCSNNADCINTEGSYSCVCKVGFSGDGFNCSDVNECADHRDLCQNGRCLNTPGGFECQCHRGFNSTEDGKACEDIDECADPTICKNAVCVNTPGSYYCKPEHSVHWAFYNRRLYLYVSTRVIWTDAQKHCLRLGGSLVSIRNHEEDEFVKALAEGRRAWIGYSDAQTESAWLWINSDRTLYTGWCKGEPNNLGGQQNCALIDFSENKCWDDQDCHTSYGFICSRD